MGIFFIVTSVPVPAFPEIGLEEIPFDMVSAVLGAALIVFSVCHASGPTEYFFCWTDSGSWLWP